MFSDTRGFYSQFLFTSRQRSCRNVMFSLACVCSQGVGEYAYSQVPSKGWVCLIPGAFWEISQVHPLEGTRPVIYTPSVVLTSTFTLNIMITKLSVSNFWQIFNYFGWSTSTLAFAQTNRKNVLRKLCFYFWVALRRVHNHSVETRIGYLWILVPAACAKKFFVVPTCQHFKIYENDVYWVQSSHFVSVLSEKVLF